MSFRKFASGGKRDQNEKPIVDALRRAGAQVWFLAGKGNPDLLVLAQGRFTPLETKQPKGKLTANQQDIPWDIVRTPAEALSACGYMVLSKRVAPQDCEGIDPEPR